MKKNTFASLIKVHIEDELRSADENISAGNLAQAFSHLERAHVLGQSITVEHTRVHWLMLRIGWKRRDWREIFGQLFRIAGASTKTPFGIYPTGNTGGANVSPFKPMPVPDDLQSKIAAARSTSASRT
jgi:hypothetical protein